MLAYHAVGDVSDDQDPLRLVVSPARLEEHVTFMRERGYRFLTAEELLDEAGGGRPAAGTAVLSFDDGWLDNLTVAAPLLQRLGVGATFFVCPGRWGEQYERVAGVHGRLLEREDARALARTGMELGSHTLGHPDLRALDDAALADELAQSKREVEAVTGRPCRTLAYPYGLFDRRVAAAVEAAGYELALAWLPGAWRRYATPRVPAPPRDGAARLAAKLGLVV